MIFQGMAPWKKSSTSHRALGYRCPLGKMWIVDASGKYGVQKRLLVDFSKQYKIVEGDRFDLKVNPNNFYMWVNDHNGLKYDYLQVFGLLIKQLFGFITFNTLGKNYKALTCNELIVKFAIDFHLIDKNLVKDSDNWDLLMTDELIDTLKQRRL